MNFKSLFIILPLVIVFCTAQTNAAQTAVTWTVPFQRRSPIHNTHHTDSSLHPAARHPGHPKPNSQPQPASPWYETKFSKSSASTLRESILDQIQPPSVKKTRISANKPSSNTAENREPVCDLQGFANKQGSALAEHILSMDFSCLGELFDNAEKSIRIRAFRASNMLSIAKITEQRANSYDGDDELLAHYYLYLRTGYYNHFYHAEEMDWLPDNKIQVDQAMLSALNAFIENPHFFDTSKEHAIVLNEVLTATDNAEQQKHFLPVYKQYLKQFNQNRVNQEIAANAVNSIFIALSRGHQRSEFRQAVVEDFELIRILKNFALSDWMLGTSVEWLAGNSALEAARFLQYDESNIYSEVVSAVQDIFDRYDFFSGAGFEISVWALKNVLYFEKCEEFQVCGVKEQLKEQVFSTGKYQCHQTSVRMQSQNLTEGQLMNVCEILTHQEMYFHDKLMTHQTPVRGDFNEILEAIVFSNAYNYILYSDLFFGNDTDNGGIYLEGDPSNPSNTARFFAYRADWLEGEPVWNLEHEHIHYLDGRFNLYGSFIDYKIDTHNTVWWAEGLAEYISLKDDNPRAFAVLYESSQAPALSQIFKTTYNSPIDFVYRWSYFAIRFMFEDRPSEVDRFLQYFREGRYDDYLEYLNISIGSKYDAEFSEWLEELKNKHIPILPPYESGYIVNTINNSRIDLLSYFLNAQESNFFVVSSNPSIVQVEIEAGRFLILKPRSPGVSEITITVQSSNSRIQRNLTVKVVPGIRTFEPRFNESLSIFEKIRTIDLSKYVEGPPKEDIIFTAESLNPDIASVHLEGSLLTITALRKGLAYIQFSAEYAGLSYGRSFRINIADGESFSGGYCFGRPLNNQQSYISEISLAGRRIADHKNNTYSLSNAGNVNTIYAFTGSSYTLGVTAGTSSPTDDDRAHRVEAWVDWNKDKIFSNETEKVMDQQVVLSNSDVFSKISSVFTVPENTQIGYVRLRARISSGEENNASTCSNYDSGEIEDHLVWVYPGPVHIQANNIAGEKQSVLKIKTSVKEIPLSEVFYTHDNSTLTYSAVSSHPDTAEVQVENNKLIIRRAVSAENFEPAAITLTAEIPAIGRTISKEFSVVFEPYVLPLILSADNENRESFVRIINNSDQNGVIHISGRDDSGRMGNSVSLSLSAGGSAHFNSKDLENGNENKGLIGALGSGQGDWRFDFN